MDSLLRKLPELDERQVKVIRKLTKSMLTQMIHDPILRVKELAAEKRSEASLDLFVQLFALEEEVARLKNEAKEAEKARAAGLAAAAAPDKQAASAEPQSFLAQLAGALR